MNDIKFHKSLFENIATEKVVDVVPRRSLLGEQFAGSHTSAFKSSKGFERIKNELIGKSIPEKGFQAHKTTSDDHHMRTPDENVAKCLGEIRSAWDTLKGAEISEQQRNQLVSAIELLQRAIDSAVAAPGGISKDTPKSQFGGDW